MTDDWMKLFLAERRGVQIDPANANSDDPSASEETSKARLWLRLEWKANVRVA